MNSASLVPTPELHRFVRAHEDADPAELVLRGLPDGGAASGGATSRWPAALVADQVKVRRKARRKLPTWHAAPEVWFPSSLALEQASSERTAHYKASLVESTTVTDLTGGMGVDSWAFAARGAAVTHVEPNAELSAQTARNFRALGLDGVETVATDAAAWLQAAPSSVELIYADPSRRAVTGGVPRGRVFRLADCAPDVTALLPLLRRRSAQLLIKTAPLLDLSQALRDLPGAAHVWVVAVANEVKEVLYLIRPTPTAAPLITALDLAAKVPPLVFRAEEEASATPAYATEVVAGSILHEPHAAALKSGAYRLLATRFGLRKLHPNSHLYVGEQTAADFPGRAFRVRGTTTFDRKRLRFLEGRARVAVRNFPLTVAQIRRKTGLAEGGTLTLLATTLYPNRRLALVLEPA